MPLSAAEMAQMSRLLDDALALDEAGRRRWLQNLAPEHSALFEPLRDALLRNGLESGNAGQFATLPKFALGREPGVSSVGDQIGPYRLIRHLGSGGMGSVWLAERSDGALKRQVALKLPRLAWVPGLAERMRRERDILAALAHPHIARLYDAGVDAQGRPYLALEYVEGEPIDRHVQRRGLPVRARLALFLQVAEAVAHAHGRLVVHRDLKPTNILVNGDGQVQLLDFGIAKLLEGDGAKVTQLTEMAGAALTPDYASPEQLRGETITVASDVYSLGVVLYEILTERRPYEFMGSAAAAAAAIAGTDVPVASRQVQEKVTQRTLRGDLDTILGKALKKDPAERYATVESFADDIKRYLAGLPVRAQPDSNLYRLRKFVMRHQARVAGALLLVLAIAAGATATVWQARRAEFEANRGIASYNEAIEHNPRNAYFHFVRGIAWTVKGDTDRAIADFDDAIRLNPAYAAAYNSRGIAKFKQGNIAGALADYSTAIGLPKAPAEQVAKALYNRGFAKGESGDSKGAIADYSAAIVVSGAPIQTIAMALNNRGFTKGKLGDSAGAIQDYSAVIELPRAPAAIVASALHSRGVTFKHRGDSESAIRDFTDAIELPRAPTETVAIALIDRGLTKYVKSGFGSIADFDAAIELPSAPIELVTQALYIRANIKELRGDRDGARADYSAAIELSAAPAQLVAPAQISRDFYEVRQPEIDRRLAYLNAPLGSAGAPQPSNPASDGEQFSSDVPNSPGPSPAR